MDTATLTPDTTEAPQIDPAVRAELEALASQLADASAELRIGVARLETAGARRRGHKLTHQVHAASRLIARGSHLAAPDCAQRAKLRADRLPDGDDTSSGDVDAHIATWRAILVALHEWRGHTASLPAGD